MSKNKKGNPLVQKNHEGPYVEIDDKKRRLIYFICSKFISVILIEIKETRE